jgi:ferrous iron transport protein A
MPFCCNPLKNSLTFAANRLPLLIVRLYLNKGAARSRWKETWPVNRDCLLPLEFLPPGETADVAEVSGDPGWVKRMAELGLSIGSRLRVVRSGSPCLLQVGNTRLSLRGDWAMQILVRPITAAAG